MWYADICQQKGEPLVRKAGRVLPVPLLLFRLFCFPVLPEEEIFGAKTGEFVWNQLHDENYSIYLLKVYVK
jgi:hypothetical protein